MNDDYELENARAWDDDLTLRREEPSQSEWTVIANCKKSRTRLPQQTQGRLGAPPTTLPSQNRYRQLPRPRQQNNGSVQTLPPRAPQALRQQRPRTNPATNRAKDFAKLASLTPVLRHRASSKWDQDVDRARFRNFPPADLAFEAIGSFHWPSSEYPAAEVLGMNYEALDPLRLGYECYIRFFDERSTFQVCGTERNVKKCLDGIRRTCFQLASRSISPLRSHLVHWRSGESTIPSHIWLEKRPPLSILSSAPGTTREPELDLIVPRGQGSLDDTRRELQTTHAAQNVVRLKTSLQNAFRKLHFHHGNLQLRARLGTFFLRSFEKPIDDFYELDEYLRMTNAPQFNAGVTYELGDRSMEKKLIQHLRKADDMLSPQDAQTRELVDVKPVYAAVFIFKDEKGPLRLTMKWTESDERDDGVVSVGEPMIEWSRLECDAGRELKLLDMSLNDLHTGNAWQFEITTAESLSLARLPTNLQNFAKNVRANLATAHQEMGGKPFISFPPQAQLSEMRQSISHRYGINGSMYTLELTQFQNRSYSSSSSSWAHPPSRAQKKPPTPACTVYEPRWSVDVYNLDWDTHFSHNKHLAVDSVAPWSDRLEAWFPADFGAEADADAADAFDSFIDKLVRIEKMVAETPRG